MTSKKLLFFMLLVSCVAKAQLTDSLFLKENSFYNSINEQLWRTPLFFTSQQFSDYTQTEISFNQKELNLKRVQTAVKTTSYNFSTDGIYNVNSRLKIFGDFTVNRKNEKDLGYNFTSQRTENQNVLNPNYFYAPKKGDWEIQNYALKGGLSYQFENNILLGVTSFYDNGRYFRKIDPRPEIEASNFGAKLHTGYTYKNHRLTVNAGMSQKTEKNSIIYVDDTQNAPVYTETFTRFSSGYGRVVFNSSYTNHIFRTVDKNFGAGYQFQSNKNTFSIDYNYNKSMENFYGRSPNGKVFIDESLIQYKYRIVSTEVNANYYFDGNAIDYKLSFNFNQNQGDNYSVAEQGQNFRMNVDKIGFNSGIIKKDVAKVLYSFEFGANYLQHKYVDLLGTTNKQLNTIDINASFNKDLFFNQKNKLNIEVAVKYYKALDEKLLYNPTASNTNFADNVIFPDHGFDVTSKLFSNLKGQYSLKLPKDRTLRIFANYSTLVALDKKYLTYIENFDTKYSSYLNAGIAIIY